MDEKALKAFLMKENPEFRKAADEHQACEQTLEELRRKSHPTEADTLLEREIKKRKLALKDRMYAMMLEHRKTA